MNNYIYEYYQKITDGTIIVGRWIKVWYKYVVDGLEKGMFHFDPKKARKAIRFVENFCRHHEGALAPQLIVLELWQKALLSVLFGVMDDTDHRQFREVVVIIARKNGKTLLAAAIAAYCSFLDGEYGGRIYFAAPKLEQAGLCYDAYYQMLSKDPELSQLSKKRRTDIYIANSNTSAKPLAFSAKKSDGLNVSLCVADEVASWPGDAGLKFYEVIKSSFGARTQPMLLAISTAGYVNEGIYDELIKRATRFLLGDSKETRLAPFLYMIDDPAKWSDINELAKANPNLGVSISVSYLLEEIAIAEGSLSKRAEFLTKYCNIKQNSSLAWLAADVVERACGAHIDPADFKNCYCVGGIDLSRTTDLTACVAIIEKDARLNVLAHFFLPAEKLQEATERDGLPYAAYVQRGILTLSGDNFVDYEGRVFARTKNDTLQLATDETGLKVTADLSGTEIGRQLYTEIKGGYTDKMSFGFVVAEDKREVTRDLENHITTVNRTITKIKKLYDVSAVSLPANDATSISARKFLDGEIERIKAERLQRADTATKIKLKLLGV